MTTLGILLQQIKEKEDHDLAYVQKIKKVEKLLKSEHDTSDGLRSKKKELLEEVKLKQYRFSEKVISEVMLHHQKDIWEDLLKEAQRDLKEQETVLDELQQSVCLNRLAFYNDIKVFLSKYTLNNASNTYHKAEPSSPALADVVVKVEEDNEHESLVEEFISLENELAELNDEEIQIEEAKRLKVKLEAEPSCGEEFLRNQKLLKETNDCLKNVEEEVASLKIIIAQKELLLLKRSPNATEVKPVSDQICEKKLEVKNQPKKLPEVLRGDALLGNMSASKTVTFNSAVEMKTISPLSKNKIVLKSKYRTKSPSPALRKKIVQQQTSLLDEKMRDIIFNDKV